jgi:hypothetical protein
MPVGTNVCIRGVAMLSIKSSKRVSRSTEPTTANGPAEQTPSQAGMTQGAGADCDCYLQSVLLRQEITQVAEIALFRWQLWMPPMQL